MASMDKWAPRASGVRDPRDPKKRNGVFHNWPRYLKFGGVRGTGASLDQTGSKAPNFKAGDVSAAGPISDRGK